MDKLTTPQAHLGKLSENLGTEGIIGIYVGFFGFLGIITLALCFMYRLLPTDSKYYQ